MNVNREGVELLGSGWPRSVEDVPTVGADGEGVIERDVSRVEVDGNVAGCAELRAGKRPPTGRGLGVGRGAGDELYVHGGNCRERVPEGVAESSLSGSTGLHVRGGGGDVKDNARAHVANNPGGGIPGDAFTGGDVPPAAAGESPQGVLRRRNRE